MGIEEKGGSFKISYYQDCGKKEELDVEGPYIDKALGRIAI